MSAPENAFDQLEEDTAETARHRLEDATKGVAALLELLPAPQVEVLEKNPLLVVGFALVAFLDKSATEHWRLMKSQLEALQEIAEGVDMLCTFGFPAPESATACQAELETTFLLKGQQPEPMYDALKAGFLRWHPDCSIEQHAAAMAYFAKLVGL